MDFETDRKFNLLLKDLEQHFGGGLDLDAVLFMIGLQELGKGHRKYSKDEKLNIMHIAVCSVLEPFGYYEFIGRDEDGWPHFELKEKIPPLNEREQKQLMKSAVLDYFEEQ